MSGNEVVALGKEEEGAGQSPPPGRLSQAMSAQRAKYTRRYEGIKDKIEDTTHGLTRDTASLPLLPCRPPGPPAVTAVLCSSWLCSLVTRESSVSPLRLVTQEPRKCDAMRHVELTRTLTRRAVFRGPSNRRPMSPHTQFCDDPKWMVNGIAGAPPPTPSQPPAPVPTPQKNENDIKTDYPGLRRVDPFNHRHHLPCTPTPG